MAGALQQAFSRNAFRDRLARERSEGLRTTLQLIKKGRRTTFETAVATQYISDIRPQ